MPILNSNGAHVYYTARGEGKSVMFLHGFTGSSEDWAYQLDALSPHYQVIALDMRGHGRSSDPPRETDYSIELFAHDVKALFDHVNVDQCCLIGHTIGGFTALEFAVRYPHRLAGLVLVDTTSGEWYKPPHYAETQEQLMEIARTQGMGAAFEYDASHNAFRAQRYQRDPGLREIHRKKMLMTSVNGYIYAGRAMENWNGVSDRLSQIPVPTCIFCGENDTSFLAASQFMEQQIPDAELIIVKDAGYIPHQESPDDVTTNLSAFLKRIYGETNGGIGCSRC